jgi:hypothetical protein
MPTKDYHSCDLNTSQEVKGSVKRTHKGKSYTVRYGDKGEYNYLYPKDEWSTDEAREHCKAHDGKFEKALQEFSIDDNEFIP